jgi:hypothetical protein
MAIYKEDGVWLLHGSSTDNFLISKLADKGALSKNSVINFNNKQFFVAGELHQISLSSNIAHNIQELFSKINYLQTAKSIVVSDDVGNRIWFLVPFLGAGNALNTVLIYDCHSSAWLKRVIPYEITCAARVMGQMLTGSADGEIFIENTGNTFSSKPIQFSFSTPFFHLGKPTVRKIIEHMNFIFDESRQNHFKFSVCKDYTEAERFDVEFVSNINPKSLIWCGDGGEGNPYNSVWATDDEIAQSDNPLGLADFVWANPTEEAYKTDIFDSNTSVQLCIEGNRGQDPHSQDDFAIVGIEFREVLEDE